MSELSFERDIRPLFRESDRDAMSGVFDLWSYDDVNANSAAILGAVETGAMPCDGRWDDERVSRFRTWVDEGKPA
jgi:hypothetical protein